MTRPGIGELLLECLGVPGQGDLAVKHLPAGDTLMPPVMNLLVTPKIRSEGCLIVALVTREEILGRALTLDDVISNGVGSYEPLTLLALLHKMSLCVLIQFPSVLGKIPTGITREIADHTDVLQTVVIVITGIITMRDRN